MLHVWALGIGGPLMAIYGLWLALNPDWLIGISRRQIARRLREPPSFWQRWQLRRLDSRSYRFTIRLSGLGAILFGVGMTAAAGEFAGFW